MQGLDSNIYFKQRGVADVLGSAKQGFTLGQMIKKNRLADKEREQQQKLKDMISQNVSYDDKGNMSASGDTLGQLAQLDPNTANKYASQLSGQASKQSQAELAASRYADTRSDRKEDMAYKDRALKQAKLLAQGKINFDQRKIDKAAKEKAEKPKEYKESQYKAAGFAKRAIMAEEALNTMPTDIGTNWLDDTIAGSDWTPKAWKSNERKAFEQVQDNFISAVLRKESGAAIGDDERRREEEKYFPQPGDEGEVLALKKEARDQAILSLKTEGGGAFDAIPDAPRVARNPRKQNNLTSINPTLQAPLNPNQGLIQKANASPMPQEIIIQKKSRLDELRKKRAMQNAKGGNGKW